MTVEPYWARIKRLRTEQGLSRPELYKRAEGVGFDSLVGYERGTRYPSPANLEAVANALGVPPDDFPEYRLARARAALDDRVVGVDEASELLTLIESLLSRELAQAVGRAGEPMRGRRTTPEEAPRGARNRRKA